jgi:hypothetical protein
MKVKFKLPVGALVKGWRHLGNGEFVADSDRPTGLGFPPSLMEGDVFEEGARLAPTVLEPYEEVLPETIYRVVELVQVSPLIGRWSGDDQSI